jgi:hypothetical protein
MTKLNSDNELCVKYGKNAKERYESFCIGRRMAASYTELYRRMLKRCPDCLALDTEETSNKMR